MKCCCLGGCNADGHAEPPRNKTRRNNGKARTAAPVPTYKNIKFQEIQFEFLKVEQNIVHDKISCKSKACNSLFH